MLEVNACNWYKEAHKHGAPHLNAAFLHCWVFRILGLIFKGILWLCQSIYIHNYLFFCLCFFFTVRASNLYNFYKKQNSFRHFWQKPISLSSRGLFRLKHLLEFSYTVALNCVISTLHKWNQKSDAILLIQSPGLLFESHLGESSERSWEKQAMTSFLTNKRKSDFRKIKNHWSRTGKQKSPSVFIWPVTSCCFFLNAVRNETSALR